MKAIFAFTTKFIFQYYVQMYLYFRIVKKNCLKHVFKFNSNLIWTKENI